MCGIFAYLNDIIEEGQIDYNAGSKRGPETTTFKKIDNKVYFAFHRLAINGLNDESNQPIEYKHLTLICNGEIYNYKQLSKSYNLKTQSDCEVILHLYEQFGTNAFHLLDGEFSFILYDSLKKKWWLFATLTEFVHFMKIIHQKVISFQVY